MTLEKRGEDKRKERGRQEKREGKDGRREKGSRVRVSTISFEAEALQLSSTAGETRITFVVDHRN